MSPIISATGPEAVTAYLAFITDHDPDVGSWTEAEVTEYSAFVARVVETVHQAPTGGGYTFADAAGEEHRFPTAVAAAIWLERHPVTA